MIVCPTCNHRNEEGRENCAACGGSLAQFVYRACPACGALNAAESAFCSRCYAALIPAAEESGDEEADVGARYIVPLQDNTPPVEAEPQADVGATHASPLQDNASSAEAEETAVGASHTPLPPAPETAPAVEDSGDEEASVGARYIVPLQDNASSAEAEERTVGAYGHTPPPPAPETAPAASRGEEAGAIIPPESDNTSPASSPLPTDAVSSLPAAVPELAHPLDGLENLLPLTEGMALPHRAPAVVASTAGESDQFDAELLRQIANERVSMREVARLSVPAPLKAWPRLGRVALSLLVLLAALTPFLSGGLTRSLVQPRPDVAALAREVAALPREATLLLSFDYGPTYAGEINPLALALARQLAQRGVRVVVMSTRAEGIGIAESIYRTIAAEQPDYRYGESYVILGYLPGQEAGLRALVAGFSQAFKTDYRQRRPLSDFAATRALASLQDVERVVVFAEDSQTVRRWVEQVQGRVPAQPQGRSRVTLDALVAAESEPLLVPYQRSGQLHHLIGCASGASEYEVASAAPAEALRRTDAYAAFFLVVVIATLAGNVAYVAQGRRKR